LRPELVFRQISGQFRQRPGQPHRFRLRFLLRRALIDPVGNGITGIPLAPTGLCFLSACRLALRLAAGMLPVSDPHVRSKPAPAYRTRSLSGRWHGDLSSSPLARAGSGSKCSLQDGWVTFAEQRRVTSRERRRILTRTQRWTRQCSGCRGLEPIAAAHCVQAAASCGTLWTSVITPVCTSKTKPLTGTSLAIQGCDLTFLICSRVFSSGSS
jgi:hypothetical protein